MAKQYAKEVLEHVCSELIAWDMKASSLQAGLFTPLPPIDMQGNPRADGAPSRAYKDVVQRPISLQLIR